MQPILRQRFRHGISRWSRPVGVSWGTSRLWPKESPPDGSLFSSVGDTPPTKDRYGACSGAGRARPDKVWDGGTVRPCDKHTAGLQAWQGLAQNEGGD